MIDAGVPVLSFIYGIPLSEILDECRRRKIKTIGSATTPEEIALEAAGLDSIVASGFEGGGHRGSFLRPAAHSLMGGLSLIPQVGCGFSSGDSGRRNRGWAGRGGRTRTRR